MMKLIIQLSKKQFQDVLKNQTTPRGISVLVDDTYSQYWQLKNLVGASARRAELGFIDLVVGRERQSYHVRILSIKKEGDLVRIEMRKPDWI